MARPAIEQSVVLYALATHLKAHDELCGVRIYPPDSTGLTRMEIQKCDETAFQCLAAWWRSLPEAGRICALGYPGRLHVYLDGKIDAGFMLNVQISASVFDGPTERTIELPITIEQLDDAGLDRENLAEILTGAIAA